MKQNRRKRARRAKQRELVFPQHGGARKGAGRKPKGTIAGASHAARTSTPARHPLLVTQRLCAGLPSLRRVDEAAVLRQVLEEVANTDDFRAVHFSIQTNHVHYICEARDAKSLARGMKRVGIRLARRLNRLWKRKGRVLADRFHSRALPTPREVRNALVYTLNNAMKHEIPNAGIDVFSSGPWFDGWSIEHAPNQLKLGTRARLPTHAPTASARTWLLNVGWRRHGLLSPREVPGGRAAVLARAKDAAKLAVAMRPFAPGAGSRDAAMQRERPHAARPIHEQPEASGTLPTRSNGR